MNLIPKSVDAFYFSNEKCAIIFSYKNNELSYDGSLKDIAMMLFTKFISHNYKNSLRFENIHIYTEYNEFKIDYEASTWLKPIWFDQLVIEFDKIAQLKAFM